jgi:hypothetical protein
MIVRPRSKCIVCKETKAANTPAIYGVGRPVRCEEHRDEENDMNLVERRCASCGLLWILNRDNLCEICDPDKFNITRLAKQNRVLQWLDAQPEIPKPTSSDRVLWGGECGLERPDRLWDLGTHCVILEVDENQHSERACTCEVARMANIHQSLGGARVVFIRYNPDVYDKNNDPKFSSRMDILGRWIQHLCKHENFEEFMKRYGGVRDVASMYLFFDGYKSGAPEVVDVGRGVGYNN